MIYKSSIIFNFPLGDSAVSKYFTALAEELVKRGYRLVIITDGCKTELINKDSNPSIYTWPSKRPTKLRDAIFLYKIISQYKPEMILGNFGAVNLSLLVSWFHGVKLRYANYHTSAHYEYLKDQERTIQEFYKIRKIFVYKFATMIFPVAKAMAKELENIYKVPSRKIKHFYNALDDPKLYHRENKKLTSGKIIYAGRLIYGKGLDVLVKAMLIITKSHPDVSLDLIGNGPERVELEKLVTKLDLEKNIKFWGRITHNKVLLKTREADIAILPSRFEACPYVLIEAMSVGTPVVASNVGGISEIIRDGLDGYLVSPEDPQELADKIIALMDDSKLRENMGNNARKRFLDKFELSRAINERTDWIEKQIRSIK